MHEFSIAHSIIETLERVSEEHRRPVVSAVIAVRPMSSIVPDLLTEAYRMLTRDTSLAGSVLEIRQVPIRAVCNNCGSDVESFEPLALCKSCGSLNLSIRSGYELEIVSATLADDESGDDDRCS